MKLLLSLLICLPLLSSAEKDSTIVTYRYKKNSQAKTQSISLKELRRVFLLTKKQSPFYPPTPKTFFNDYLRFKLGVETALHDKKLVKSSSIANSIVNPFLKESFFQELYKAFAEAKLQKQVKFLAKKSQKLGPNQLRALYAKSPQYNFFYITINHPINPTAKQVKEARLRAQKVYGRVVVSKKSFPEMVQLTSDDKINGLLSWNQTKSTVYPSVYKALQKMKDGGISKPIKTPFGYLIVKLNKKIPYSKKIHEPGIKEAYFSENRTKAFNKYMNALKKDFVITYKNRNLINSLK